MAAVSAVAEVRAVVIAARGPHFTVGLDLKAMGSVLSGGGTDAASGADGSRSSASSMAARARAPE